MKKLLLVALILISYQINAQVMMERGKYGYRKALKIEASKTDIYAQAHDWIEQTFEEDKYDVHYADETEGTIVVKGTWYHDKSGQPNEINFTFKLEVMDGIYRESFEELSYAQGMSELPFENKKLSNKKKVIADTGEIIEELSVSLISFMQSTEMAAMTISADDQLK